MEEHCVPGWGRIFFLGRAVVGGGLRGTFSFFFLRLPAVLKPVRPAVADKLVRKGWQHFSKCVFFIHFFGLNCLRMGARGFAKAV